MSLELTPFLISQILAVGTLIAGMAAFQFRERTVILRGWFVAALFGSAHFWFLGAYEACLLVGVTALRFLVSSFTTDRRAYFFFMALALAGFVFTYQSLLSLLPLAATLVGTWGSFQGTDRAVRWSMFGAQACWVTFNIIIWSPVAILVEVMFFSSNLIGMLRHKKAQETAL